MLDQPREPSLPGHAARGARPEPGYPHRLGPNGCEEDFDAISALAEDALAQDGVRTYAIDLAGSSESEMDQLAEAGGTGGGIFIDDSSMAEQQLLEALNTIRGQNLGCDFPVPAPLQADQTIDPDNVSVTFVYGSNAPPTPIARGGAAC